MVFVTPPVSPILRKIGAQRTVSGSTVSGSHTPYSTPLSTRNDLTPFATPILLGRRSTSLKRSGPAVEKKTTSIRESPAASQDLGKQFDDEVWLVVGGTGMAGYGILKKLSRRGEAGGVVLAPTRGPAQKAWMDGALPGITALQADINDPEGLKEVLKAYPPVTHVFYSALVRTSFNGFSKKMDSMNIVTLREMQRSIGPAFIRGTSACCCGGTGVYDMFNTVTGCGDVEDNRTLFKKIFQAVDVSKLRYCCVVTGAKHYGMHLGPDSWPQYQEPFREDMPESPGESAYAALEEELQELSVQLPQLSTLVLRPTFILGSVPRPSATCMNLSLCLGVYALLCKQLGEPLRFLGTPELWNALHNFSHSDRIAQLAVNGGAVLPAQARRMALNASDAEAFCYAELWPQLAAWAGCCWEGPLGRNGISFSYAMGGRTMEALNTFWEKIIAGYGLREYRLEDILNTVFLEQSMSVSYNARLDADKCKSLHWASPRRDGGWTTLRCALADLSSQGLLPEAP